VLTRGKAGTVWRRRKFIVNFLPTTQYAGHFQQVFSAQLRYATVHRHGRNARHQVGPRLRQFEPVPGGVLDDHPTRARTRALGEHDRKSLSA